MCGGYFLVLPQQPANSQHTVAVLVFSGLQCQEAQHDNKPTPVTHQQPLAPIYSTIPITTLTAILQMEAIALKLLGGKLAPKLLFFVLKQELLNFSEMAPWCLQKLFEMNGVLGYSSV